MKRVAGKEGNNVNETQAEEGKNDVLEEYRRKGIIPDIFLEKISDLSRTKE
jgi:hypothetical protein